MVRKRTQTDTAITREYLSEEFSKFDHRLNDKMDSKFDIQTESLKSYIESRFSHVNTRFDSVDLRFDDVETEVKDLKKKIDNLDRKLDVNTKGLVELIERRNGEISELDGRLKVLEPKH